MSLFPENKNLNFWHLGAMLGSSAGLPGNFLGYNIAIEYGAGTALTSIVFGNLLAWTIAFSVVFISIKNKCGTIDLAKRYLGNWAAIAALLCLTTVLLGWFAIQTDSAVKIVAQLTKPYLTDFKDIKLRSGAALGLIISLLATGGIQMIRRCCIVILPLLLLFFFYHIVTTPSQIAFANSWGFSFSGTLKIAILAIPGTIYFPVIFRYARSKADAFLGLSLMTIFIIFIECGYIWIDPARYFCNQPFSPFCILTTAFTLLFVFSSLLSINLINIYLAAATWKDFISQKVDNRVYAVAGLIGTVVYVFIQVSDTLYFFQNLINGFIINFGFVILISVLMEKTIKHQLIFPTKWINSACWVAGCVVSSFTQIQYPGDSYKPIIKGIGVTLFAFIITLFLEELVWAIKRGRKKEFPWH